MDGLPVTIDGIRYKPKLKKCYENRWYVEWYDRSIHRDRKIMRSTWTWRMLNGPTPTGYEIHHKDGNKQNDSPDNLEPVLKTAHTRLHGYKSANRRRVNGLEERLCLRCGRYVSALSFCFRNGRPSGACDDCRNKGKSKRNRQKWPVELACLC